MASTLPVLLILLGCLISVSATRLPAPSPARPPAPSPAGNPNLIHQLCNGTQYPDFCIKTLSDDSKSHGADTNGLVAIAIRLAAQSANATSGYISGKVSSAGQNTGLGQCLSTCAFNYGDALTNLKQSMEAVAKSTYNSTDVNNWLSTAQDDSETCLINCDGLDEASEVLSMNTNFNQLCSIALGILPGNNN